MKGRCKQRGIYHLRFKSIAIGEFGKTEYKKTKAYDENSSYDECIYDQKVLAESGFDGLMSPQEFEIKVKNGEELPLFFVRSSLDTSVLKKPKAERPPTLLDNPDYVKVIRANTVTPNVDYKDGKIITTDTKAYMEKMGMGYQVNSIDDIFTNGYTANQEILPEHFNSRFVKFCETKNIDLTRLIYKEIRLRAKPNNESYGCYGQLRGEFENDFIKQVKKEIAQRGSYIIQPELQNLNVINTFDGEKYVNIDRNFVMINNQGEYEFVAGFRSYIPKDSTEARKNNIHGNDQTIYTMIK